MTIFDLPFSLYQLLERKKVVVMVNDFDDEVGFEELGRETDKIGIIVNIYALGD